MKIKHRPIPSLLLLFVLIMTGAAGCKLNQALVHKVPKAGGQIALGLIAGERYASLDYSHIRFRF